MRFPVSAAWQSMHKVRKYKDPSASVRRSLVDAHDNLTIQKHFCPYKNNIWTVTPLPALFMKSSIPSGSPAPASPFTVANPAQAARPGLRVPVVIQPVFRRATLAPSQNPLQNKGSVGLAFQRKDLAFHE